MTFEYIRLYRFSCQNLFLSSISLFLESATSRNPFLGLTLIFALAFALTLAPVAINELFKQFIKAYLKSNQGPRKPPAKCEQPLKAKVLEMYYVKLHMDCYYFRQ